MTNTVYQTVFDVVTCGENNLKSGHPVITLIYKIIYRSDYQMLKVYICPVCGNYRFVTSYNYTCYKCHCAMTLADIEYKKYIDLDSDERQAITNKYKTAT